MSPGPHTARFRAEPTAPAAARRWASDVLALSGMAADDVELMVSELVSNAVLHAGLTAAQEIVVHAGWEPDGRIRLEICDEGGRFDKPSAARGRRHGGRGLAVVRSLCDDAGVRVNGQTRFWLLYRPAPEPV